MRGYSLKIIACIPAFKEEETIKSIIEQTLPYVDTIVVCDDGSNDLTANIAENMNAEIIRHPSNLGYGAAIRSLFQRSKDLNADIIITLDADGQHNPQEIPKLIDPILNEKADIVLGSRLLESDSMPSYPFYRRLGIRAITKLTNLVSTFELKDAQCGFRAYNRKAIDNLILKENGMGISVEIIIKANDLELKVLEIPVSCAYKEVKNPSTQNPLTHGLNVLHTILRVKIREKPTVLRVPGIISILTGLSIFFFLMSQYITLSRLPLEILFPSVFIIIGFCMVAYTFKQLPNEEHLPSM